MDERYTIGPSHSYKSQLDLRSNGGCKVNVKIKRLQLRWLSHPLGPDFGDD